MNWREYISGDPRILVDKPIVKGTRICVGFVIDLLDRGWTTEQVLCEHDHLNPGGCAWLPLASDVLRSERV